MLISYVCKPVLFVLCTVPLGVLLYEALILGDLGANPVETITYFTGDWTLRFLLITLAITPLRRMTGVNLLIRFRRMLGLFAFFYALLHFLTYLVLDQTFDVQAIVEDVIKRPYTTIGFSAFVLLWPLALTSTNAMMRRLGRRWAKLHQLVYVIALLGVFHYLWLVKADPLEPVIYALIFTGLMAFRWRRLQFAQALSAR